MSQPQVMVACVVGSLQQRKQQNGHGIRHESRQAARRETKMIWRAGMEPTLTAIPEQAVKPAGRGATPQAIEIYRLNVLPEVTKV